MEYISRAAKNCGGGQDQSPRLAETDSLGDAPVKSIHCRVMNRSRAAPRLTVSKLHGVAMFCRGNVVSGDCEEADVEVGQQYVGVGSHANVVVTADRLACEVV